MRHVLHKIAATITQQPREVITPVWSKSIVVNAFRVYEYWFGRRAGIRIEGSMDSKGRQLSYTWEHLFAVYEGAIRDWFAGRIPKFKIVYLPQLEVVGGMRMNISPFRFAIAFDNAAAGSAAPVSFSYTVTGTNPYLFASAYGGNGSSATLTSATYNSVNLVAGAIGLSDNSHISSIFGASLSAPATGANTLAMVTSAAARGSIASSYSGVKQAAVDATGKQDTAAACSVTINTATANCWMIMHTIAQSNTPSAGTNATSRSLNNGASDIPSAFDSNGTITTGGFTMTANYGGAFAAATAFTVTQSTAVTVVLPFRTLLGVGI